VNFKAHSLIRRRMQSAISTWIASLTQLIPSTTNDNPLEGGRLMQPTALSITTRVRVRLSLTTLALLIVIATALSGCNKAPVTPNPKQPPVGKTSESPTPLASPSPIGTPHKEADTIIVVKDGSIGIGFADEYKDTGPFFNKKFVSKDVVLYNILVEPTAGPSPSPAPTPYPLPNPRSTITINAGSSDKDIRITGKPDRVELKFDRKVYKDTCTDPTYKYCNRDLHILVIKIDGTLFKTCTVAELCKVTLHTKSP
jgi:hypothetical protein